MSEDTTQRFENIEQFTKQLGYQLDTFQRKACESLEIGRSVLVAAPTGSGKTTVAEFAVFLAQRKTNSRIFYTAPIKALSNQKFHELCEVYGKERVGLLTGDVNIRGNAPIVVMTTEVLRNMIYSDSSALSDLAFVVLDEVHYLADKWRGAVWEEIILHLPSHVRLVSLSATVSNAEEFGDWMHAIRGDTDVILSNHRPVPLYTQVITDSAILPFYLNQSGELAERGLINPEILQLPGAKTIESAGAHRQQRTRSRGRAPVRRTKRIRRSEIAAALEQHDLLPGIVFIFSRNGCDQAVSQCLFDGVRLTTQEERAIIREIAHEAITDLTADEATLLGVNTWLAGCERGFAAHHAGLLPQFKSVVEQLFQQRLIKLVFATETLALGINMPARSVTIEQLEKFNGEERVPLTSGEFTQLTGRAGRRGIDHEGHAVIAWGAGVTAERIATLVSARTFPVKSSFSPTPNMVVNLLQRLSFEHARDSLELSFAQFQADREVVDLAQQLRSEQQSLDAYEKAAKAAKSTDKKRWLDRARKMRKHIEGAKKRVERKSGSIARTFERVVFALQRYGYVEGEHVNEWGMTLSHIYGERDLLVAECIREKAWRAIDPAGLAALVCALVYEPRRDEDPNPKLPRGSFDVCFERTIDIWHELDEFDNRAALGGELPPHPGLSYAMYLWAQGNSLHKTLDASQLSAGDFVRWAKQTIDLLDQIAVAANSHHVVDEFLEELAETARKAKQLVKRGIIETSSRV